MILYVLGILLVAVFTKGYAYSASLSVASVLGYNFFFTVPRFTLKIDDLMYLVTFFLMLAVGLGISAVTFQLKKKMAQINALNLEKIRLKNNADKELAQSDASSQHIARSAYAAHRHQKRRGDFKRQSLVG